MTTTVVTAWHVEEDQRRLRRLGKSLEEVSELGAVLARCIIQGIDEIDPSSGKTNRLRLQEEVADVRTQIDRLIFFFSLDKDAIFFREIDKNASMERWEELISLEGSQNVYE